VDKIIDAFKRSWHFKPGSHPIENSNKLTIFEDGYKSRDAEIERLRNIIENMPAKYIPESYWKAKP